MKRKYLLIGVIIVSAIIASGLVLQTGQRYYYPEEEFYRGGGLAVSKEAPQYETVYEEAPAPGIGANFVPVEPQVIVTSYVSLEVEVFQKAADEVGSIAEKYGGYVANSFVQKIGERKIGYVTVRIPEDKFGEAMKEIETIGTLLEQNVSLEDVTEQYIDVRARLDTLKQQEARYLEILKIATTVEDILKVETQLERIRGEIESLQGTLNYMENRISLSTIEVQLSEPEKAVHESRLGDAFDRSIEAFLSATRGIIIFLGFFIPITLFLTVLVLLGFFLYRKMLKR